MTFLRYTLLLHAALSSTVVLALTSAIRSPTKVVVTGASGKTGRLVFEALLENPDFEPKALVRSEKSGKSLKKAVPATGLDQIVVCDVTQINEESTPPTFLEGCEAMVICTSAMPRISKISLLKALLKAPFNIIRGKKAVDFRSFKFVWKAGQYPEKVSSVCAVPWFQPYSLGHESAAHHCFSSTTRLFLRQVDYEGQIAQIEMAKKVGISHVVVVGSMGGTDPDNFLNAVGKNADGSGNGDILLWKRRAEKYLVESGLAYTIIHPGGLKDTPAGREEIIIDVDDKLLNNTNRSISRGDVAALCVASLSVAKGQKVAFDCVTKPVEGDASEAVIPPEEALEKFLEENKVYNYAL